MTTLFRLTAMLLFLASFPLSAQLIDQEPTELDLEFTEEELTEMYQAYTDSIEATLTFYSDTTVIIGEGMAELAIPAGYRFIYGDDAQTVLVDMWGNPPNQGVGSLGMLFSDKYPPSSPDGYGIDIFHTEDGYIDDEDAVGMDYDDLLEELKADTEASNEARREEGYQTMELIGWATSPRYDAVNKRLHWAKELHFEGTDENTLNYNILFLGRRGYLTMNVIGGMKDLPEVNSNLEDILGSVAYLEGYRYSDFDASIDEVAAYGIGALIAGKVLAKTGLLAGLGIFLAKAWKLIALAGVALMGVIKKLGGKSDKVS